MIELIKKEAELTLYIKSFKYFKYFKRNFYFKIKQGSFKDIVKYDYYLSKDLLILDHLFKILNKINPKFKRRHFNKLKFDEFKIVFDFVTNIYCKSFYTLSWKKTSWSWDKIPFYSIIWYIIINSNETLKSLLGLHWEAINYLYEWIIRNKNNETKEGRKLNRSKELKKEIKDWKYNKSLERIKKNRKKVLKNLKFN